ncbi:DUF3813 domain-containing protein [Ectobacillus sp. sgz5001026]|uniref:DUF3813 domain-containing protein n=1 Tax=Ectobacillus sp. sgz5001026 TaxID=3242473 RepID=UPI0036D25296
MGNMLFQQARDAVGHAVSCNDSNEQSVLIEKAKNALSSAYSNSTTAEKQQLRQLQQEIQAIEHIH